MKQFIIISAVVCAALIVAVSPSPGRAQSPLQAMETEDTKAYAEFLSGKLQEFEGLQVKIEPDYAQSVGLSTEGQGMIVVADKNLKEGEQNEAAESDPGAALGYLFLSTRFFPLNGDAKVEKDKLRTAKYDEDAGDGQMAAGLILAARHIEGDDWRLYVYGTDMKPLVDTRFREAEDQKDDAPRLAIRVEDVADGKATLVLTLFGKYEASFGIAH